MKWSNLASNNVYLKNFSSSKLLTNLLEEGEKAKVGLLNTNTRAPQSFRSKTPQLQYFKVYQIMLSNRLRSFLTLKGSSLVLTKVKNRIKKILNPNLTPVLKLRSLIRKMRQKNKKHLEAENRNKISNPMIQQTRNNRNLLENVAGHQE